MTLMFIEPSLLNHEEDATEEQTKRQQAVINDMALCINRVIRQNFRMIGKTSLGQLIVCIEINNRDKAKGKGSETNVYYVDLNKSYLYLP
jgi:hypothetical protein